MVQVRDLLAGFKVAFELDEDAKSSSVFIATPSHWHHQLHSAFRQQQHQILTEAQTPPYKGM